MNVSLEITWLWLPPLVASAFKAKQYLSVGIPTVASDVRENNKFVLHKNGLLCNDDYSFATAITKIIEMNDKDYFDFSQDAIQNKEKYSMQSYCNNLLQKTQVVTKTDSASQIMLQKKP